MAKEVVIIQNLHKGFVKGQISNPGDSEALEAVRSGVAKYKTDVDAKELADLKKEGEAYKKKLEAEEKKKIEKMKEKLKEIEANKK